MKRKNIDVPYAEKDEAKAFGAKWDPKAKTWYIPEGVNPAPFAKWLVGETPYIYLVIANRECWKCHNQTEVVGFGIPYCYNNDDEVDEDEPFGTLYGETTDADSLAIVNPIGCVPAEIRSYIEKRCGYRKSYSRTVGEYQMANTCTHCHALQGNFMLFGEVDSPFFIFGREDVKRLAFIKVEVAGVYGELPSYSTADQLLFDYATAHHEDFGERLIEGIYL